MHFLDFRSLSRLVAGSWSLQSFWPVEKYLTGLEFSWSPSCRFVVPSRLAWISMMYLARSRASTLCACEATALGQLNAVSCRRKGALTLFSGISVASKSHGAISSFMGGPSVFLSTVFLVRVVELNVSQPFLSPLREDILSVTLSLLLHLLETASEVAYHVCSAGGCSSIAWIYFSSDDDALWRKSLRVLVRVMRLDPCAWHRVHEESFQPCLTWLRTGGDSHVDRAAIMIEGLVQAAEYHHRGLDSFCRNPPCYSALRKMTECGVLQSLQQGLVRSMRREVVMSALCKVVTTPWCGRLDAKLQMLRDSGCVDDLVLILEGSACESFEAVSLLKLFTHLSEGGECINTVPVASCIARALGRHYHFNVDGDWHMSRDFPFLGFKDRTLATFRNNCLRVLAVLAVGGIVPCELHSAFLLGSLLNLVMFFKYEHDDEEYPTWACALLLVLLKTDDLSARWLVGCEAFRVFRSVQQDAEAGCYMNSGRIYVPVSVSAFFRLDDSVLSMSWCCRECADLLSGMAVVGGVKRKRSGAGVS